VRMAAFRMLWWKRADGSRVTAEREIVGHRNLRSADHPVPLMLAGVKAAPTPQKMRAGTSNYQGCNEWRVSWPTLSACGIEFDIAVNVLTGGGIRHEVQPTPERSPR
jgi:hypothetical protein